jgi:hypothetical protein
MALRPIPVNSTRPDVKDIAGVDHKRPEIVAAIPRWTRINDCIGGEDLIKSRKEQYLPIPDADANGKTSDARYINYALRAVFYNVTGRTLTGLVGQVFGRESKINLPESLKTLEADVAGDGVGIEQQAKKTLEYVLSLGRAGLLVDYPKTTAAVSREQQSSGEVRPIIKSYRPEDVINWRTKRIGAKIVLSLVVLTEWYDTSENEFEVKSVRAYRVLRLDVDNNYTVQLYVEDTLDGKDIIREEGDVVTPVGANGKPFKFIPFTFVGPENNDSRLDAAPLYAMANLNIAHFRNSADYEDACFIAGQPTPYFAGLTTEWVKNVMKGKAYLGSRGGIMLPKGGTAGLLQATANSMPKEAMEHKEKQMVALGAKLVEERTIRRTATESRQDEASETSILSSSTKNVNVAYNNALTWASQFAGGSTEFEFEINSDFDLSSMTPNERQQLIQEWQSEAITWKEMRTALRRTRVVFQDDEAAKTNISENPVLSVEEPPNVVDDVTNGGGNDN